VHRVTAQPEPSDNYFQATAYRLLPPEADQRAGAVLEQTRDGSPSAARMSRSTSSTFDGWNARCRAVWVRAWAASGTRRRGVEVVQVGVDRPVIGGDDEQSGAAQSCFFGGETECGVAGWDGSQPTTTVGTVMSVSFGRVGYGRARVARQSETASRAGTAIGRSHQAGTEVVAIAAVPARARTTPAAIRESSPTMKPNQYKAKLRNPLMRRVTGWIPGSGRRLRRGDWRGRLV
jgi:hypothetical protein